MLSGIILQPGAWDATRGLLDEVFVADNVMENVASPVTLWTKPGNTVGRITVSGLDATGIYRSAFSAESWADAPITNLVIRGVRAEFTGGGKAWPTNQTAKGPGVDVRALPSWGFYARHVQDLTLEDVRLSLASDDLRPVLKVEAVERLSLDRFKFSTVPSVTEPLQTNRVGWLMLHP